MPVQTPQSPTLVRVVRVVPHQSRRLQVLTLIRPQAPTVVAVQLQQILVAKMDSREMQTRLPRTPRFMAVVVAVEIGSKLLHPPQAVVRAQAPALEDMAEPMAQMLLQILAVVVAVGVSLEIVQAAMVHLAWSFCGLLRISLQRAHLPIYLSLRHQIVANQMLIELRTSPHPSSMLPDSKLEQPSRLPQLVQELPL